MGDVITVLTIWGLVYLVLTDRPIYAMCIYTFICAYPYI